MKYCQSGFELNITMLVAKLNEAKHSAVYAPEDVRCWRKLNFNYQAACILTQHQLTHLLLHL